MKILLEELNYIKYLFGYQKGKVISEQKTPKKLGVDGCENGLYFDCTTKQCIKKPKNTIIVYTQEDYEKQLKIYEFSKQRNLYAKKYCDLKNKWASLSGWSIVDFLDNPNLKSSDLKFVQIPGDLSKARIVKDKNDSWDIVGQPEWNPNNETVSSYINRKKKEGYSFTGKYFRITEGEYLPQFKLIKPILGCLPDGSTAIVTQEKPEEVTKVTNITPQVKELAITCDLNQKQAGNKGEPGNNYIGYEYNGHIFVTSGDNITINLDSLIIPDAFYVKYGDKEFFSGFRGATESKDKQRNFQNELNSFTDLKSKIQNVITTLGGTITVSDDNLVVKEKGPWSTTFVVKEKITVKIIVFSPLDKTEFIITAKCYDV